MSRKSMKGDGADLRPNVMNVLNEESIEVKQPDVNEVESNNATTLDNRDTTTIESHSSEDSVFTDGRASFYMDPELLDTLEDVAYELKKKWKRTYSGGAKGINKSKIAEVALQHLIDDYEKKGDKSILVKHFSKA
jgi:hypothetical protein